MKLDDHWLAKIFLVFSLTRVFFSYKSCFPAALQNPAIKKSRIAASFRGISRLLSTFRIRLRLAHICVQEINLQKCDAVESVGYIHSTGNQFQITLLSPKFCKQFLTGEMLDTFPVHTEARVDCALAPTSQRRERGWTGRKLHFSSLRYDQVGNRTQPVAALVAYARPTVLLSRLAPAFKLHRFKVETKS